MLRSCVIFFFSSRRRHTRLTCDWSSDVCSSDLLATVNGFLMLDLIYILTMGGPGRETTTISWLGFQTTFAFFKFGPGTAILYTLTGLCLLLTFIYHRLILARFEPEA